MGRRVELLRNAGALRGRVQAATVLREDDFDALARAATNKLRLSAAKSKGLRLFLWPTGTELRRGEPLAAQGLENGSTVAVSVGEDFITLEGDRAPVLPPAPAFAAEPSASSMAPAAPAPSNVGAAAQSEVRVFCDLDGVLADFASGVKDAAGRTVDQLSLNQMWAAVRKTDNFFGKLPWTQDGRRLWDAIAPLAPTILTGTPKTDQKRFAAEKARWCSARLGGDVPVVACLTSQKSQHAGPGALLIDDNEGAREAWERRGGTFIHHTDASSTIAQLLFAGVQLRPQVFTEQPRGRRHPFPELEGDVRPLLHGLTRGNDAFEEADRGEWIAYDYLSPARAFPSQNGDAQTKKKPMDAEAERLRRECRGLLVCPRTGRVFARRFHKFFNVDETAEASSAAIGELAPGAVLHEKLDGALVSPVLLGEGQLFWATRRERALQLEAWVAQRPRLNAFARDWLAAGWTPLFEWLRPDAPLHVRYESEDLVLIAMRRNSDGLYMAAKEMTAIAAGSGIRCVRELLRVVEPTPIEKIIEFTRGLEGVEGAVLTLADGQQRFKLKSEWYLENVRQQRGWGVRVPEADLAAAATGPAGASEDWQALLSGDDDLIAGAANALACEGHHDAARRLRAAAGKVEAALDGLQRSLARDALDPRALSARRRKEGWPLALMRAHGDLAAAPAGRAAARAALRAHLAGLGPRAAGALLGVQLASASAASADAALRNHVQGKLMAIGGRRAEGPGLLVVLRGLPGAGKSTIAQRVAALAQAAGLTCDVCSADDLRPLVADVAAAHERCRAKFDASRADVVVVDNTNVRRKEYAYYLRRARASGMQLLVLELRTGADQLPALVERNRHGVDAATMGKMHGAWEVDHDAVALPPVLTSAER